MSTYQEKFAQFLRKTSDKAIEAVENFDYEKTKDTVINKSTELYGKAKELTMEDVKNYGKTAVDKVKNFDPKDFDLDVPATIPKVLAVSANIIDREEFLREAIGEFVPEETAELAIAKTTKDAGIRRKLLDMIAEKEINAEVNKASGVSVAAGSTWATLPADVLQYFGFVLRIVQKLAYLYGCPAFEMKSDDGESIPEETLNNLSDLIGIMFAADQEEKTVGSKMGKLTLAKGAVAPIPVLGGVLSGGVTFATLKPYANNLKNALSAAYEVD